MLLSFSAANVAKIIDQPPKKTQTRRLHPLKIGEYEIKEPKRLIKIKPNKCLIQYPADNTEIWVPNPYQNIPIKGNENHFLSMGGPKHLYRNIRIQVIRVWKERLGDISPKDCIAEGVHPMVEDPKQEFIKIWNSCYPSQKQWNKAKNRTVWCHELKLIQKPVAPSFEENFQQLKLFT